MYDLRTPVVRVGCFFSGQVHLYPLIKVIHISASQNTFVNQYLNMNWLIPSIAVGVAVSSAIGLFLGIRFTRHLTGSSTHRILIPVITTIALGLIAAIIGFGVYMFLFP